MATIMLRLGSINCMGPGDATVTDSLSVPALD